MAIPAPKPFTRYNVTVFRSITAYLQNTNANSAFNRRSVQFSRNVTHMVNGYIGVETPTSNTLIVAFTWGSLNTGNRHSFVVEIDPTGRGMGISFIEKPASFTPKKAADYVKAFIASVYVDIHNKMVTRTLFPNQTSGGSYTGVRLEAHRRDRTLPSNKFATHTAQFTANFAANAPKVHVTLK